jgi:CIC family chloride channel protein
MPTPEPLLRKDDASTDDGAATGPPRPAAAAAEALAAPAETEDRLPKQPMQWLGLMVVAALVGAVAGVVGSAFRETLTWFAGFRLEIVHFSNAHLPPPLAWLIPVGACGAGGWLGLWLTQRFAPHTAGSGIPRVESVLRAHLRPAEGLILPVKFVGGALSIGSGMALGREGPTVQMGGTIGRLAGDAMRRLVPEPWTLIAAGAGAGLAVAFNAPLAAALFVMEELLHRFSTRVFSATLIACIAGTVVLRALCGGATDFAVGPLGSIPADALPEYFLLGLAAGAVGVAFNRGLISSLRWFRRTRSWPRGAAGALVGACAGLLLWFDPVIVGGGERLAQRAIIEPIACGGLAALLLLRFTLTMGSYGCGAPGGIFAPLLALGALAGNLFASACGALTHSAIHPAPYAIVAMAACFTAIVRSPLTGVVLLLEMTGSWTLILPMMAASLTAYIVPELLGVAPIYDALRELDEATEGAAGI